MSDANHDRNSSDYASDEVMPIPEITNPHEPVQGRPLEVKVDDRGVERAIRKLRRLMASEGILREIKRRRHYEKPSIALKRKEREADRRRKRRARKTRFPV
jgi:small subunit ribosomal protein S21